MPGHEVDIGGLELWERQDYNARALKTSNRDGPNWKLVMARETICADTGDVIEELRWIEGLANAELYEPFGSAAEHHYEALLGTPQTKTDVQNTRGSRPTAVV